MKNGRHNILLAVFFLVVLIASPLGGQEADGTQVIVMVDTSQSMFSLFDELLRTLLQELLAGSLSPGDTLHLLSFSSQPEIEFVQRIDDETQLKAIDRRALLLIPLGRYTDLVSAVKYLIAYARKLPEKSIKRIYLLTDGIHDPPPESPYRDLDFEAVRRELLAGAQQIRKEGWSIHILQMPQAAATTAMVPETSPKPSHLGELAEALGVPVEKPEPPAGTGTISSPAVAGAGSAGASTPGRPPKASPPWRLPRLWFLPPVLILLLLLIWAGVKILRLMREASYPSLLFWGTAGAKGSLRHRPIAMQVELQNSRIGLRNVHRIAPHRRKSVGGDGSAYLIYFVPMPRRIGYLVFNGLQYTFLPARVELFPKLSDPLPDCLGKKILVKDARGHLVTFSFHEYVSPLEELNRLMRSIKSASGALPARHPARKKPRTVPGS